MITKWITTTIASMTRKSHDVKLQLLGATMFGLISIFGTGGAFIILMKARKLSNMKVRTKSVTKKPTM